MQKCIHGIESESDKEQGYRNGDEQACEPDDGEYDAAHEDLPHLDRRAVVGTEHLQVDH
jgi:hypothetical protein